MTSLDPYRYIPTNAPLTKAQIEAMAAEQRKKDEAAAKTSNKKNSSSGTYNTAKQTVANTKPTSYNTAQLQAAQALKNAGQVVPKPSAPTYNTLNSMIASDPLWTDDNTAMLEAKKAQARNEGKNVGATTDFNTSYSILNNMIASDKSWIDDNTAMLEAKKAQARAEGKDVGAIPITPTGNGYIPVSGLNRPTNGSGVPVNNGSGGSSGNKTNSTTSPDSVGNGGGIIPNPNPNTIPSSDGGGVYPSGGGGGSSAPSAPSGGYYDGANWSGGMSYKPYPTAEEMANYVSTIIQAAKGELGDVIKPEYMDAEKPGAPELRTLEELAKTFGITYDYDSIYKILNDSVEKQYDAIYQRQKQNEDKYYDNAAAAQNTLLDTLSRDRSNAVSAGVSKGMQAANALGAMLGVSQQFANNATALSQERSNTAKDYGASLAKAVVDAEATSNERKNAIMEISKMLYGYDSEQYVANMDNYNTILTNNAALQQAYMNNHTALQNALASIFGGVAANKITGDANVQSSTLAAYQSYLSNQAIADATRDAANASANANKWIAQLQAGLLDSNEVPKADGTGTTNGGGSSNALLAGALSTIPILNTGLIQNALGNVKDIVGATVTGLHNYKGMNK